MKHQTDTSPKDNAIYYTTTDGKKIGIDKDIFDAKIISHSYKNEGIIVFDKPITKIPGYAFSMRNTLQRITIPESVKTFYISSFNGCINLEEFNHSCASSDKRCLISKGVLKVFAPAKLTEYTIPNGVVTIGKSVFRGTKLKKIVITEGVQIIDSCAFQFCKNLSEVIMPNSLLEIGQSAFSNCTKLKSIVIPSGVTKIGDWAFVGCKSLQEFNSNLASTDKRCLVLKGELVAFAPSGISEYKFPSEITSSLTTVLDYNPKLKGLKKELKETLEQRKLNANSVNSHIEDNCGLNNKTEIIAISQNGYINKIHKKEFVVQELGSKGIERYCHSDSVRTIKEVSINDTLLIFTKNGRFYKIKVVDIPNIKESVSLNDLLRTNDEVFCAVLPVNLSCDSIDDYFVLITTNYGACVRHKLSDYIGHNHRKVITLNKEGYIVSATLATKNNIITCYSLEGNANAFEMQYIGTTSAISASCGARVMLITEKNAELKDLDSSPFFGMSHILVTKFGYISRIEPIKVRKRCAPSIKMIKLKDGDSLIFGQMFNDDEDILIVTKKGYTFRTNISKLAIQQRCKKNAQCISLSENDEVVACCKMSKYKELVIDINDDKFKAYQQETNESQSLLSTIFNNEDIEENVINGKSENIIKDMLSLLFAKEQWDKKELETICKDKGLILGAILEEVNDYSYSKVDDAVVEEDGDCIYVTLDYKNELL